MSEIHPHRLYSASELNELLGKRTLERLRIHGLVALGGLYLGQNVIDSWLRAVQATWQCRRGLGAEEITQKTSVEESHMRRSIQRLPKPKPGTSLQDQLERARRDSSPR